MMNLAGVAFAIAAIILYCINVGDIGWWRFEAMCQRDDYWYGHRYDEMTTASPSPDELIAKQKCLEGQELSRVSVEKSSQQSKYYPVV